MGIYTFREEEGPIVARESFLTALTLKLAHFGDELSAEAVLQRGSSLYKEM